MTNRINKVLGKRQQQGVAMIEFALIAAIFFILLFGILELGRLFYVINSVQEVTRRAAREAVVRWTDEGTEIKRLALFGGSRMPAGAEIVPGSIKIDYLTAAGGTPSPMPANSTANIEACLSDPNGCIALVRVSITGARYKPMAGLFSGIKLTAFPFSEAKPFVINFSVPIPASTVTMPAESLGYTG